MESLSPAVARGMSLCPDKELNGHMGKLMDIAGIYTDIDNLADIDVG